MDELSTPRGRYRGEVRTQIKRLAETQLAELGPGGLSLSGIAREVGMSGPALYRYFASRDALLAELVADAYDDLADALAGAVQNGGSVRELLTAYRSWARRFPHRYRLLYQPPIPGFDPNDPSLVASARRSMEVLIDVLGRAGRGSACSMPAPLSQGFGAWAGGAGVDADPSVVLLATLIWSRVHGFVSLEISGNFTAMVADADALFAAELDSIAG